MTKLDNFVILTFDTVLGELKLVTKTSSNTSDSLIVDKFQRGTNGVFMRVIKPEDQIKIIKKLVNNLGTGNE